MGWLSSEAARGSASTLASENKPIFSSTVICHAPAISRMNCRADSRGRRGDEDISSIQSDLHSNGDDTYRDFHSDASRQQPLPAGDGRLHAVCREHLEGRPAEVVQQLRVAVWRDQRRSSFKLICVLTASPSAQHSRRDGELLWGYLTWTLYFHFDTKEESRKTGQRDLWS